MTRDELVEHCKRKIAQCERWAAIKGEEITGDKVYDEHRFILALLTQPREDEISLADAIRLAEQGHVRRHRPFNEIAKQACHEDNMQVLEKIKNEIEGYKSTTDRAISEDELKIEGMKAAYTDCLEIVDKYMDEIER